MEETTTQQIARRIVREVISWPHMNPATERRITSQIARIIDEVARASPNSEGQQNHEEG